MANGVYNKGLFELASALTDLDASDLRVLLVNASYVFAKTHNFVSDVSANEITVVGYARQALANKVVTEDDTNHRAYLDADDMTFLALATGQTINAAVIFRNTGVDTTSPLLLFIDLTDAPTDGDFKIKWAAPALGGITYLAQAA